MVTDKHFARSRSLTSDSIVQKPKDIATWKRQIDDILAPQGVGTEAIETSSLRFKKLDTPNHYSIKKYEKNLNL